ncbi:MAG: SMP-30/gluconolactonase/LRE family protein [Geminicoccaceae bacterium]
MRRFGWLGLAVVAAASPFGGPAAAAEIEIVAEDVRFPEGPLWFGGSLLFVEYGGHTILRLDRDGTRTKLWERPGCGPSALASAGADLLVTCYDENSLVLVSATGETLQVYQRDDLGVPFVGPNDFATDATGGVFMSASGPWETAPIVGKILYRGPEGGLRPVADDLHYANGLALSPDGKTLYCSETYAYRIVAFDVGENGSLANRREFARVNDIAGGGPPLAPDGLKTDAEGNLYIALYEGGKVLVADPEGKLLATIDPPAPNVSNVGFGDDASTLYITGVLDGSAAPWPGEVYRVANPVPQ